MNYNNWEDERIRLERVLNDVAAEREYYNTDEARTAFRSVIDRNEIGLYHYEVFSDLSPEAQNLYIDEHIGNEIARIDRREILNQEALMNVRARMLSLDDPLPAAGADSSSRSVSTYSDEEGFDVGFINEYDEGVFTRVPMRRTDATIERLIERPRLHRSSAVRPGDIVSPGDIIWPEDEPGSPDYDPGSPAYTPSPVYDPNSPMSGSPMPSTPTDPMPSYDGNMDDDSIGSTTRFFALLDGADSTESSNDPEIIDVDPTPPGSPVRTPPPGSPTVPSRPRRSRGRGGNKTKRKQKKGQTRKKVKRKNTKKRKGKSVKKTKKRK